MNIKWFSKIKKSKHCKSPPTICFQHHLELIEAEAKDTMIIDNNKNLKIDRTMTWLIVQVWSMTKMKFNCHVQSDKMWSIMKIRHDNDVTDYTSVISIEYDNQLSRLIRQCVVYDEDEIRQRYDQSYRSVLCQKRN